eukprot:m.140272 g.140272  ORF g.140272 m.140272 type:complete len:50 (-) comp24102_c0_seq6:231-380(-)
MRFRFKGIQEVKEVLVWMNNCGIEGQRSKHDQLTIDNAFSELTISVAYG